MALIDCIDWVASQIKYGTTKEKPSNKRVICICPKCNQSFDIIYKEIKGRKYDMCRKCIHASNEFSKNISKGSKGTFTAERLKKLKTHGQKMWEKNKETMIQKRKELWQDPKFVAKKAAECRARNKEMWKDKEGLIKKIKATFTSDRLNKMSKESSEFWQDDSYREKTITAMNTPENLKRISETSKKRWENTEYKHQMAIVRGNQQGRPSSIQKILYNILADLKIQFHGTIDDVTDPKCIIGPYSFDCAIPRKDKPMLLIECQGDYWHSRPKTKIKDEQKAAYITNNFPGVYELRSIWEHEFGIPTKIRELLKYWTGITQTTLTDIKFSDIVVKNCTQKECIELLSTYHYLQGTNRAKYKIGAYHGDKLIAVCTFSRLIRQNIHQSLGYQYEELLEISRLCINPQYQHKNLASWFISRCMKMIDDNRVKKIIAYSDTTFNHTGTIYKASNFKLDKIVPADYWYNDGRGWVMHKKTLYNKAAKMSMTEAEYAARNGYSKIYGKDKLRFVYDIRS